MSSPRAESSRSRQVARWLWPAALLALAPKCVLCLLAYAGLGAALGLSGPEWCSASGDALVSGVNLFAWLGLTGVLGGCWFLANCRAVRSSPAEKSSPTRDT